MVWDPPIRVLVRLFNIDQAGAAIAIMQIGILLPLIIGPGLKPAKEPSRDNLLFSIPLLSSFFL